jgi:hypothetical protein
MVADSWHNSCNSQVKCAQKLPIGDFCNFIEEHSGKNVGKVGVRFERVIVFVASPALAACSNGRCDDSSIGRTKADGVIVGRFLGLLEGGGVIDKANSKAK